MPVPATHVPGYCHHKARGLAYVRLGDKVTYLGRYNSPESRAEYDRLVAAWMANGRQAQPTTTTAPDASPAPTAAATPAGDSLTVREFATAYLKYAKTRYLKNRHFFGIRSAFIELDRLFRSTPLTEFGPKKLKELREAFIKRGLIRREINRRIHWVQNGVKWAVAEELCPGEVYHRLAAVEILRRGEAPTRESQPVRPVDEEIVTRTIEHVSDEVAAMVRLQLLTGARSGEIVLIRACDIEMTGDVWKFRPQHHKTEHHGHERVIAIGPRGREVIQPFLTGNPSRYLFSPAKAEKRRRRELHEARTTAACCGNNVGRNKAKSPEREPGDRYTPTSYNRAIARAIEKAFPLPGHLARKVITPNGRKKKPRLETRREWWTRLTTQERSEVKAWWKKHHWHVHQLRHNAATRLRKTFGLDQIQATLGHSTVAATQIYAELQREKAVEVARLAG